MWPFSTIKKNYQEGQIRDAYKQALDWITLSDFDGRLYIAYMGNPLILLEGSLTGSEIVNKLSETRKNYINSRIKELCPATTHQD